jgi:hypothetical protein
MLTFGSLIENRLERSLSEFMVSAQRKFTACETSPSSRSSPAERPRSGKTLILAFRAEYLARAATKPVLILCFANGIAARLEDAMQNRGVEDRVQVLTSIHGVNSWCYRMLRTYGIPAPSGLRKAAPRPERRIDLPDNITAVAARGIFEQIAHCGAKLRLASSELLERVVFYRNRDSL